jgi:formate C-acetyltransferase
MDLTKNIQEAKRALTEKPMLATSVERILILNEIKSDHKDWPQPKRFPYMLRTLLSRVSTPIEPYDLVAGRCVDRVLSDEEEAIFQAYLKSPDRQKSSAMLSSGHCSYDWDALVTLGLPGLRRRAEQSLARKSDPEERVFLEGAIEIYDTLRDFMLRYADAADRAGMTGMAKNLRKGATAAPDDFCSALQLLWIVAFVNCAYITGNPTLTLGRMDQFLYPLYKADLESGRLTRAEAAAWITDYYCKHNLIMGRGEHQVGNATNSTTFERICNFDAPQYLLLAGTHYSESAVNDLTLLMAECIVPEFKNPVVVVRYFKGMNEQHPALWRTLCEKSLQSASLMYYNDTNVKATYARMGIPAEDIEGYIHFGCNWPGLGTNSSWMLLGPHSVKFNAYLSDEERAELNIPYMRYVTKGGWPMYVTEILREVADQPDVTIDDIYDRFFAGWGAFVDRKLARLLRELQVRQRRPSALLTFTDCFLNASVEKGQCHSATAKYHFEFQSFYMFGTTTDCFVVVDELVFRQKKLTIKELLDAADANFEGYPEVLALCRSVPKYGSDSPLSNAHAKRLSAGAMAISIEKSRPYIEKYGCYVAPCMQSDTWHLKTGMQSGATVNGRLAGTSYSQNSRPANGSCTGGVTGMLNAMLNLPSDGVLSGALNLDVAKKDFMGENGLRVFSALLATYFNGGGLHAQVSTLSREDLVDAQVNPAAHRDLRVRVTGYSGVFVDICKELQDDIIERFN